MKTLTIITLALFTSAMTVAACVSTSAGAARRQQQSSWGDLQWFELEIDPFLFRFSVLPGSAILYSKNPREGKEGDTWLLPREDPKAASVIKSLDALIRKHHLMESAPNEPEKTFRRDTMTTPSVHLRIGYGTDGQGKNKRWQSFYPSDSLPDNVKEFIDECKTLGDGLGQAGGPPLSEEQTLRLTVAKEIARVKITSKGVIYLNRDEVSLEQLGAGLERLQKAGGAVLYYQVPPEDGFQDKSAAALDALLRKIKELKLPVFHSKKGF
jgi:hypothetical protein